MEKQKHNQYIIEREFLSKITIEELLIRIINSHVNIKTEKIQLGMKNIERNNMYEVS